MTASVTLKYAYPPPPTIVNREVRGLVSHVETDCFWLQVEQDKVARLTLCMTEESMGQDVPQLEEGDSVVGWWEGDLYRGVIIKILEEGKILVRFVDWGNMAVLGRDMVRKTNMEEVDTVVGAVKCRLLGRDLLSWTEILGQSEYMVQLRCVAMYQDIYMMTETTSSPLLPTQEDIPGTATHVCEDRTSLWFCPADSQSALDILMDNLDQVAINLNPLCVSHVFPGQLCAAKFTADGGMYRARVIEMEEQTVSIIYIDYGDREMKNKSDLWMLPDEMLTMPPAVVKVDTGGKTVNSEQEDKLVGEEVVLRMVEDSGTKIAKFFVNCEEIGFLPEIVPGEALPLEKKVSVPKGCIIEISMSDEEEIEVSDGEEAQTEANPTKQVAVPVTVNHVENVSTVWITRATMYSALDRLVDQLVEMEGQLTPLTNVGVGDMVLARFTEDEELYRGKVISIVNDVATVLFIDFGESEQQSVNNFMELPVQFMDLEPLAERVKLVGVEMMTESEECREMVDRRLNKEGISMTLNDKSEAIFWENGQNIKFIDLNPQTGIRESSMTGWKAGDEVAYMTAGLVWRRGVIMMVRQDHGQVKVMGEEGMEMMVDIRHVKNADIPLEALNKLEEDIKSVHLHHGEQADDVHLPQGEGDVATAQQVSPVKHLPTSKILDVDEDIPDRDMGEDSPAKMLDIDESPSAILSDVPQPTPASSLPPPTVFAPARAVFTPTATLTQQVITDWIASCLHIINTKKVDKYKDGDGDPIFSGLLEGLDNKEEIIKTEYNGSYSSQTTPSVPVVSSQVSKPSAVSSSFTSDPSTLSPLEFLVHCQTPSGSERIKNLLSSGDEMARARILQSVVSSDLMEMMISPLSCQVVQKLLSCLGPDLRDQLGIPIIKQMFDLAVHPFGHQAILALLAVGSQDQRDMLTSQLERKNNLLALLKDKQGSFVVQRCLPYLRPETVSSMVSSLESSVVEVGCHPHSSFCLQEFFRMFSGKDKVDILQDRVMDSLEMMMYNQVGHWVVQTVIKLGHPRHITMATTWLEHNMQEAVLDSTAVFVARTLVQQLLARSRKGVENTWSLAMDKLVGKMMDTMVVSNDTSLPLFIVAAMHHAGHILVQEVVRQKDWLGHSKVKVIKMLEQNRLRLRVDTFGCLVVKGFEGWM